MTPLIFACGSLDTMVMSVAAGGVGRHRTRAGPPGRPFGERSRRRGNLRTKGGIGGMAKKRKAAKKKAAKKGAKKR